MMMADWLQGPYVYALYASYGYSKVLIGRLFIMGFGASMVLGTFVGSLADRFGRKSCCLLFGIVYSLSCLTKHSPDYSVLMAGRLFGGVATSLLFSVFESWMVKEHFSNGYSGNELSGTFTKAYFGNSVVAILAGLVGGMCADNFGPVGPFDASLCLLVLGTVAIFLTWTENYGDSATEGSNAGLMTGVHALMADSKLVAVGAVQSLFEGSMYTFVFMWTPALESQAQLIGESTIPHGTIFAIFMVSCMIGSMLVKEFDNQKIPASTYMCYVFPIAAAALAPACLGIGGFHVQVVGFCVFEGCCGVYFPTWGNLRSAVVPEELRSTILNLYRVPLNLIVVIVLYHIGDMSTTSVFMLCVVFLVGASAAMAWLSAKMPKAELIGASAPPAEEEEEDAKPLVESVLDAVGVGTDGKDVEV
jgi:MFS family permease